MQIRLTTICENTAGSIDFIGEWGLCILVEHKGETVLLDTGLGHTLLHNAIVAGVDLSRIDKMVLSHGHVDHAGGLRSFLQARGKEIEIFAHPEIWNKKYVNQSEKESNGKRFIGIPFCREELESLGALFLLNRNPIWINDHTALTGEIPMVTSYEELDKNMYIKSEAGFKPDTVLDDQAMIIKTPKGLVVILGCAHHGVINTILYAQEITGIEKIHAIVGGAHLFRANRQQLKQTIIKLKYLGVEMLGLSHCTGMPATIALAREFGANFFFNNAGTAIEL